MKIIDAVDLFRRLEETNLQLDVFRENGQVILQMYHYKGGNCQILEEELIMDRPPHDDIKDALSQACMIAKPPMATRIQDDSRSNVVQLNKRFGGAI